jgi:hypothetical protein
MQHARGAASLHLGRYTIGPEFQDRGPDETYDDQQTARAHSANALEVNTNGHEKRCEDKADGGAELLPRYGGDGVTRGFQGRYLAQVFQPGIAWQTQPASAVLAARRRIGVHRKPATGAPTRMDCAFQGAGSHLSRLAGLQPQAKIGLQAPPRLEGRRGLFRGPVPPKLRRNARNAGERIRGRRRRGRRRREAPGRCRDIHRASPDEPARHHLCSAAGHLYPLRPR